MRSPHDIYPTIHKPFVLTPFRRLRVMTHDCPRPASPLPATIMATLHWQAVHVSISVALGT